MSLSGIELDPPPASPYIVSGIEERKAAMTYTVKKLATMSGVSVRTLRYYDAIGLLKPAYYGDNQYRYYEEEQVLLLQQILFYRELGFPLDEIQRVIGSDDFNKITALASHKRMLAQNLDRTTKLIKTIDHTIAYLQGEKTMRNEELFSGFAHRFAYESYVTAFAPGNDVLLDQYFAPDLLMVNHAMRKQLNLHDLKMQLPTIHKIFHDLKSEVKDVIADEDRIAFRIEQHAIFTKHHPNGVAIKLDTMNLYKLESGKVKEWQIWVNMTER